MGSGRFRFATFNVRHGQGGDGVVDVARTAATIRQIGADFVALQELDRFRQRSGGIDQAAALADLTGLDIRFFPTFVRATTPGEYGIAVCATSPFDAEFVPLRQLRDEEPRGAIVASWRGIGIVATHLSRDRNARRLQTAEIVELARALPPPVVVMGDLNQERCSLRPLKRAGFRGGPHLGTIGHCRRWGRQIDHILVGPGLAVTGVWLGPRGISDHCPLVAELHVGDGHEVSAGDLLSRMCRRVASAFGGGTRTRRPGEEQP
jgi:endonuclease/exonuclease/phosphatase family metal-dependent hydrolase